jgi:hypothetical protein
MAKIRHRKVRLAGQNLFCHYTHGVADTSLVSLDACPDSFYPVRPGADETRSVGWLPGRRPSPRRVAATSPVPGSSTKTSAPLVGQPSRMVTRWLLVNPGSTPEIASSIHLREKRKSQAGSCPDILKRPCSCGAAAGHEVERSFSILIFENAIEEAECDPRLFPLFQ